MARFDKDKIKDNLTTEMVFSMVQEFGGEPLITDFGFVSKTICHNAPHEGSRKLYYYENTRLFRCYTGCDSTFDIFELISKIRLLSQPDSNWSLFDSVRWVAGRYGWGPEQEKKETNIKLSDWDIFDKYSKLDDLPVSSYQKIELPEYNKNILNNLSYPIISDWENEGISREIIKRNIIGYYPKDEQITIPHFDIDGRFIGLRGRTLGDEEANIYGKYRPLMIGGLLYNHPLSLNLYNINNSAKNINKIKKAIIFEGEKSALLYQSYFGSDVDISVACCGSQISQYQMSLLLNLGATEVIIAFDRQFQQRNDDEFQHLTKNLTNIHNKYSKYVDISFIFDKEDLLPYKASPIDCGKDTFLYMYKKRIRLE